jgi:hypothetical protein
MKLITPPIFLVGLVLCGATGALAQKSDLASPPKRDAVLATAGKLLKPRELAPLPENLIPPFSPPAFEEPDPEELKAQQAAIAASPTLVRPAGDRGILEALAGRLAPSGTAILGGEAILLFGQKRLKVGDQLTITFEGFDYILNITDIGRTTFTLRLNREEITRPIKSGK